MSCRVNCVEEAPSSARPGLGLGANSTPTRNALVEAMRAHLQGECVCSRAGLEAACADVSCTHAEEAYEFLSTLYGEHPFDAHATRSFIECYVDMGSFATRLGDAMSLADPSARARKWAEERAAWDTVAARQRAVRDEHGQRASRRCRSRALNEHAFATFTRLYRPGPIHRLPKWMLLVVTPAEHALLLPRTFWFDVSLRHVHDACVRAFLHHARVIEAHLGSAAIPSAVRASWAYHEARLECVAHTEEEVDFAIAQFLHPSSREESDATARRDPIPAKTPRGGREAALGRISELWRAMWHTLRLPWPRSPGVSGSTPTGKDDGANRSPRRGVDRHPGAARRMRSIPRIAFWSPSTPRRPWHLAAASRSPGRS